MIAIIDNGGANIASIQFALARLGMSASLTIDKDIIKKSTHVILPGVGSAKTAMERLAKFDLISVIKELTQPILGICLGMQLLFDYSFESSSNCLKIINGKIQKLSSITVPIPHMGWNTINIINKNPLFINIPNQAYVYFVHSFYAELNACTSTTTTYETVFSSAIQYKNFFGVQFHPERSGKIGQIILKNFLEL